MKPKLTRGGECYAMITQCYDGTKINLASQGQRIVHKSARAEQNTVQIAHPHHSANDEKFTAIPSYRRRG